MQLQREAVHIEARKRDFAFGRRFANSMIGAGEATRPELVAVKNGPEGREEICTREFLKLHTHPLEFMEGIDSKSGLEALDYISNFLTLWGYEQEGQGSFWYQRLYWRPYTPPQRLTEGDPQLISALNDFLRGNPYNNHALAAAAFYNLNDGNMEWATQYAEASLRMNSINVIATTVLGFAQSRTGHREEARALAQKAIDLAPGFEFPEQLLKTL
ncbi:MULTISPECIES: M48 family metallopeptidase [unclassified Streptomyces]|uniref:tetratricopeptide repeat protein n=1 Tax=unclassified Streptomyces TaxID=2593676 RepID=UPI002254FC7B|nr:hypothetical protein [Streptomyces sp. NBC_00452]MCX5056999.1 hypothetical protein [Streptomyces sp. NBC_00452]